MKPRMHGYSPGQPFCGYRMISLDVDAASRLQIGWVRFWVKDGHAMVEISATFAGSSPAPL